MHILLREQYGIHLAVTAGNFRFTLRQFWMVLYATSIVDYCMFYDSAISMFPRQCESRTCPVNVGFPQFALYCGDILVQLSGLHNGL